MLVAAAALGLFFIVYADLSRSRTPASISRELFAVIGAVACVYALLAGPFSTVDTISREKREGTLGLLFLTDLTAFDVVLGKMFAASLDLALGMLAIVPVLAVPFMMGGVTLVQFLQLACSTAALTMVSLAVGVIVSSLAVSARAALGITVFGLAFLTFVPIFIGDYFRVHPNHPFAPVMYSICPAYTFVVALDTPRRLNIWGMLWHFSSMTAFAAGMIIAACAITRGAWRGSTQAQQQKWFQRWTFLNPLARSRWRAKMLSARPITWLEGRSPLSERFLRIAVWLSTGFWILQHLHNPNRWPDMDVVITWPMFSHFVLCLWIAADAPRRFSDDKQSGALELLLCTPYSPGRMVADAMRALRGRFLGPLLLVMSLAAYSVVFFIVNRGRPGMTDELLRLAFGGMLVIPTQAYVFARVGLYQGLVSRTSLRATAMLIAKLFVLPWILFAMWVISVEVFRLPLLSFLRGPKAAFTAWPVVHLAVFAVFLTHANSRLSTHFRRLAASR